MQGEGNLPSTKKIIAHLIIMYKSFISIASKILFIVYASLSIAKHGVDVLSILVIVFSALALILELVEVLRHG